MRPERRGSNRRGIDRRGPRDLANRPLYGGICPAQQCRAKDPFRRSEDFRNEPSSRNSKSIRTCIARGRQEKISPRPRLRAREKSPPSGHGKCRTIPTEARKKTHTERGVRLPGASGSATEQSRTSRIKSYSESADSKLRNEPNGRPRRNRRMLAPQLSHRPIERAFWQIWSGNQQIFPPAGAPMPPLLDSGSLIPMSSKTFSGRSGPALLDYCFKA
jgi:hypothetical protein